MMTKKSNGADPQPKETGFYASSVKRSMDKELTSSSERNEVYVRYSYEYYLIHKPCTEKENRHIKMQMDLARKACQDEGFIPEGIKLTYYKNILVDVSLIDERLELQKTLRLGENNV